MKQKKVRLFRRIKNAIFDFDEYKTFAEEKLWSTIKYIIKIAFIFSLIVSFALAYRVTEEINNIVEIYKNECPEFKFENNTLIIDNENKQFVKGDSRGYIGILMNSEKEQLKDINETSDYQIVLAILKDKIIIKSAEGQESSITYEELSNKYDISKINKQEVLNIITSNEVTQASTSFVTVTLIYLFIAYLFQFLLDVLVLSVIGYILSRIIGVSFKYKSIFNMSAYSVTLSIMLYMVYLIVSLFTGFTIKYFEIAYNAISYIYIITAMLMIKSDLLKQQVEVGKIVEEQKKVREEQEEQQKNEEDKEKNNKEKKQKNKDNNKEEVQPEGNEA